MRSIFRFLRLILFLFLVIGAPTVTVLAFYIGSGDLFLGDPPTKYTVLDAFEIIFKHFFNLYIDPTKLSATERTVLFSFGYAIILLVSLVAVIFSSLSVYTKLQALYEIVPYDKYRFQFDFLLRWLRWLRHIKRLNGFYETLRASAYKNLSVKTMVHHYKNAEHLIIISGDYSWLFDNAWSDKIRTLVSSKLPDNVKLLSYKTPEEVSETWKQYPEARKLKTLFLAICFGVDSEEHKASIVETATNASYIHLYKEVRRSIRSDSVCVFYGDKEAGELVRFAKTELLRLHSNAAKRRVNQHDKVAVANNAQLFDQSEEGLANRR
jgi:hypothetical protein